MSINNKISFYFRNQWQTIDFKKSKFHTNTTLLEYLRSLPDAKGTKESCNQGDCGACTVVLAYPSNNGMIKYEAVNSCLIFLPAIHNKWLITIEDLSDNKKLHPIQQAFIENNASQCGFCTPGFIMSAYALFTEKTNPDEDEILDAFSGNLCRCTGYQSIKKAINQIIDKKYLFSKIDEHNALISLKKANKNSIYIKSQRKKYFITFNLKEVLQLINTENKTQIISGATDLALKVTKHKKNIASITDLTFVEELKIIENYSDYYKIGAGVSIEAFYNFSIKNIPEIAHVFKYFGSKQIRNKASIAGNIASASPISDTIPLLMAVKAKLIIKSSDSERTEQITDFITDYRQTTLQNNEIITHIEIKKENINKNIFFYKISKRKDLDIATISLGANAKIENDRIISINLFYGGMAKKVNKAINTEKSLIGKTLDINSFENAKNNLSVDFLPISDARSSKEARIIMAKNLLIKYGLTLIKLNNKA